MQPGARLGDWIVLRELGRGGMGAVVEVRHATRGSRGALKVLTGAVDDVTLRRFDREANAGAGAVHPNLVRVIGTGRDAARPFIVMELAAGGSLEQRVKQAGRLPWREAAAVGAAVARGLAALHESGFVHRDLKPANVLFDEDGRARVSDFGLVRQVEGGSLLTASHMVIGTPAFLSPEQANGRPATPAADVYGLGCTLHAVLTGAPPFKGQGFDVLRRHIQEPAPDVRQEAPDAPEELARLVRQCLAKDPAARPAAGDVAARLEALGGGAKRGEASRPVGAAAALVALAALLALAAWLALGALAPREPVSSVGAPGSATVIVAPVPPSRPGRARFSGDVMPLSTVARTSAGVSFVSSTTPKEPAPRRPPPVPHLRTKAMWGTFDWIHGGRIDAAVFLPGGDYFATGGTPEHNVRLFDRGRYLKTWPGQGPIRSLALTASADELLFADDRGTIMVGGMDRAPIPVVRRDPPCAALVVACSFDGHAIAAWADGLVRLVGVGNERRKTPDVIATPEGHDPKAPAYKAAALATQASLALLVDGAGGATLRRLDPREGSDVRLSLPAPVAGAALDADGTVAVLNAGGHHENGTVFVLDPHEPAKPATRIAPGVPVRSVFASQAAYDHRWGYVTADAVHVFEGNAREPTRIEVPDQLNDLAFCGPLGRLLITAHNGPFRLHQPERGLSRPLNPLGRICDVAVSDDGKRLATIAESGVITAWDGGDRPFFEKRIRDDFPRTGTFSTDGRLLAVRGDKFTRVLSLDDGESVLETGSTRSVSVAAHDEILLVELAPPRKAVLRRGSADITLAEGVVTAELSSGGGHACLVMSASVVTMELRPEPRVIATRPLAGAKHFERACLDPTWSRLATITGVRDNKTCLVQLWDVASGTLVKGIVTPHAFSLTDFEFDPSGRYLATAGYERRLAVWDARDGSAVADTNTGPLLTDHVAGLAFTAGGRLIGGASRGQLLLFDLPR